MARKIKCPACGKDLDRVGYTEHGTRILVTLEANAINPPVDLWVESDDGADSSFYCLECNRKFDLEDLEEAGII